MSSLPGPYGIGDLGPSAYRFVDYLNSAGQHIWQVLPLVPAGKGHSPYASPSTFAGNPLFISPDMLMDDEYIREEDLRDIPASSPEYVDYERVSQWKSRLLQIGFKRFRAGSDQDVKTAFDRFKKVNAYWLNDYAIFMTLSRAYDNTPWTSWPRQIAKRRRKNLSMVQEQYADTIGFFMFEQFLFFQQWTRLKQYCKKRSISIFGDLPIYVAHNSADVWAHQDLFYLDEKGQPTVVAGVPPDCFSRTGQLWGNPIYRWDVMSERGYIWWMNRLKHVFQIVDLVRIDHFRGFSAYWEIPSDEKTAENGRWIDGPGEAFFRSMRRDLGPLPVVAEDLGIITPDVRAIKNKLGYPGMAVLQFAFETDATNEYLPHNFDPNVVAYTGTHDNDTLIGWWQSIQEKNRETGTTGALTRARTYLQVRTNHKNIVWSGIRVLMSSVARIVIVPMQDVLGLGSEARMNTPGKESGNWVWRLVQAPDEDRTAKKLRSLTALYGRSSPPVSR